MAITGQHRYLAAKAAGLDVVPTIDIRDIFAETGQSFDDLWTSEDYPTPSSPDFERVLLQLPGDVAAGYGIES